MSPLWPKTISVGLFPGDAWIRIGAKSDRSYRFEASYDPYALVKAADAMLQECGDILTKGTRLVLTVSDSVAAIAPLQWQDNLYRREELNRYAQINFERAGIEIGGDWAMHTEFPQFKRNGISYALPKAWLAALDDVVKKRSLCLVNVLPNTVRQYLHATLQRKKKPDLMLLQETHRISALTFGKDSQLHYDLEPVTGSIQDSALRVVKRASVNLGEKRAVTYWSSEAPDIATSKDFVQKALPTAEMKIVPRSGAY